MTPAKPITTHQAAGILRVTPMTVIRWIDRGQLKAWKTAGGHRRIERADLEAFALAHGFPGFSLDVPARLVLVPPVVVDAGLRTQLEELLSTVPDARSAERKGYAAGYDHGRAHVRDAIRLLLGHAS